MSVSSGDGTNVDFANGNVYGRSANTSTGAAGDRIVATAGGAEGDNKLWLPIWSGEVMRAYDHYRMFEPMVQARSIASGRAMEFPITGTMALKPAWGAGEELVGNTNDHASKTVAVTLDARPIATHFEIDNVDLMITQWEYRAELARQAGQTLANARDFQIAAYLIRAGAESIGVDDPRLASAAAGWRNSLSDAPIYDIGWNNAALDHLGDSTASADDRTDAALDLLAAIEDFMVHLQTINADTNGVYCAVTPQAFQDIRALGVARVNTDLAGGAGRPMFGGVAEAGGLGTGLSAGMNALADSLEYMGCTIVKSNHIPNFAADDTAAYEIGESRYNLSFDAANVKALIWQSGAVASLQKTGLKVDTVDDIRRNTIFTVASMLSGTGVLKPELCSVVTGATAGTRGALATLLGSNFSAEYVSTASGSGYYS